MEVLQLTVNDELVNLNFQNAGNKKRCEIDLSHYIKKDSLNIVRFTPPCQNKLDIRRMNAIEPVKIYIKLL